MTDISSFRSIQGSTGFVQQRESDETQFKAKGTTPFFGKIAEFFSGSRENQAIKAVFLDALTQTYGDDFRTIAEAKIKPDSGKPLPLRVLRDLKQQGDLKQLSARQPTVKFELGAGTSEEITLTGSVYKDRKQIAVGAQRFLQNNGIKGDTNILKDIGTIYNDSTIVGKTPDPDTKLKQEWDFIGKYGPEGSDLLNAFLVGPKFDDVAEALKAIRAMGASGEPNPLTTAYLRHFGLESPEGVDINHPALKQPERIDSNFGQFFGQLGLLLTSLQDYAVKGDIEGFQKAARELVHETQATMERFHVGAQVLSDPEFLNSVPSEHRDTLRALGEQYQSMYRVMTDPNGRFQQMLAFGAECLENPTVQMNALKGPDQPVIREPEQPLSESTLSTQPENEPLLPGVVLPPGMELKSEDTHVLGSLQTVIDGGLLREELQQRDFKTDEGNTPGITAGFETGLDQSVTIINTGEDSKRLSNDPSQARDDLIALTSDQPTEVLHLSKFLSQEMYLSMMEAVGKSLSVTTETEPSEQERPQTTFGFKPPTGDDKLQMTEVSQDDDNYYIDYHVRGELNSLVYGDGDVGLQLDNGLGSSGEVTMRIRIAKDELRRGGSEFEIIEPLTVNIQAKIDPNRTGLLD